MGVFGAVNLPPDRLKEELDWIDKHCGGKPYGVDLIVPNKMEGKSDPFNATPCSPPSRSSTRISPRAS